MSKLSILGAAAVSASLALPGCGEVIDKLQGNSSPDMALIDCAPITGVRACVKQATNEVYVEGVIKATGQNPTIALQVGGDIQSQALAECSNKNDVTLSKTFRTLVKIDDATVFLQADPSKCQPQMFRFDRAVFGDGAVNDDGGITNDGGTTLPLPNCDDPNAPKIEQDGCRQ